MDGAPHRAHGMDGANRTSDADGRYIGISLGLILAFMLFEVTAAVIGHSLALLADAGHMLTDAGALVATLVALRLARRPSEGVWTFGLKRAEVLSAQANGMTLLVVGALVTFEAVTRLIHPPRVTGAIVIVVAIVGVVVNAATTLTLGRADRESINVKGAFQHIVTDLYAFVGTLIAGIVIVTTGFRQADAIASLFVVALMARAAWGLLRETGRVLLEAAPEGADPAAITKDIIANPAVESVHDLHVWLITSGFPALSAHVIVTSPADCHGVRRELEDMLRMRHQVDHTTLQVDHATEDLLTIGPAHHRGDPPRPHHG